MILFSKSEVKFDTQKLEKPYFIQENACQNVYFPNIKSRRSRKRAHI